MNKKLSKLADLKREVRADIEADKQYAALIEETKREFADDPAPAVAQTAEPKEEARAYALIDEAAAGLAQDGRDFIAALCWMATGAGFTAPSISLLLAVAAYEDRHEKNEDGCEITDPELAEFKGCSERTIQRWRRQYLKEEKYLKVPFLQITEGDFDKGLNANRPTRYRFLIDLDIADAVLEARAMRLHQSDRLKALRLSALRVYDSLAKPLGKAAVRRRKKKKLPPDSERKRLLNTIRTSVAKLREIESRIEGYGDDDWEVLKTELEVIYKSPNPLQVVAEIKANPTGRQNVASSVVVVKGEGGTELSVSKDAPVEYDRTPATARMAHAFHFGEWYDQNRARVDAACATKEDRRKLFNKEWRASRQAASSAGAP